MTLVKTMDVPLEPETRQYIASELARLYSPPSKVGEASLRQLEFVEWIRRVKDLLRKHGFSAHAADNVIAAALGISVDVLNKRLQRARAPYS